MCIALEIQKKDENTLYCKNYDYLVKYNNVKNNCDVKMTSPAWFIYRHQLCSYL